MKLSVRFLVAGSLVLAVTAGCTSAQPRASTSPSPPRTPAGSPAASPAAHPGDWAAATSAADGGGMAALIAAARKEGTLNVIALPPSWANYAVIMQDFSKLYGIQVHAIAPNDAGAQEIAQIRQGAAGAADVLDLDTPTAMASTALFAPYEVSTWAAIPAAQKAPDGAWVQDYGGFMSVGYDPSRFGTITSLSQLTGPKFARAVALDGNPTQAYAALSGVMMANLALGGTADAIANGVAFFRRLAAAGNFVPVAAATALTIKSGTTPVVFNWDYLNTAPVVGRSSSTWKVFIPPGAAVGFFYAQAINKDAPHPAAARLWEEFLYSQAHGAGQNLWLEGGVRPVELTAMVADGSADAKAAAAYPPVLGTPVFLTASQAAAAERVLAASWSAAVR